jgi:hypothetical protein
MNAKTKKGRRGKPKVNVRREATAHLQVDQRDPRKNPAMHRRVLGFINQAVSPEDLMFIRPMTTHGEGGLVHQGNPMHEDNPGAMHAERKPLLTLETARRLLAEREKQFPLGFQHIDQVFRVIDFGRFRDLFDLLSDSMFGRWDPFPQPIPRRGPGGTDGVVHAALCHTGKVLFITADETTVLWDPNNLAPSTFEDPINQPHLLPGGHSVLCGHHVFLNDGQLLCVGGGGYGPNPAAVWGFKYDPGANSWSKTANPMSEAKWYPTASVLNDDKVLVTDGTTVGNMDIFDVATSTFSTMSGDTKPFPNRYPGLHLLPSSVLVYSRTGWGTAGPGGFATADNVTSFFTFTSMASPGSGMWTDIAAATVNRAKGMSVLLYSTMPPFMRIMVLGGVDNATNNTYEMLDVSVLSPLSTWSGPIPFPDGEHRSLGSAVLLPDGNVFVCGGIQQINSPCAMYNPVTDTWAGMAALPSTRDYHSTAILLPSGQVMMAGWQSTQIEIYSPPYLFAASRPVITTFPSLVHHGQTFVIESPDAPSISKVVLVRPMAITHQTDTEQRVLDMPVTHDPMNPTQLTLVAPHGGHPHAFAPKGYYMLFAVRNDGVPSEGKFIFLH